MLSNELEYCLNAVFQQAHTARHAFLTIEHLLQAILAVPRVSEVLRACGADLEKLQQEIGEHLLSTSQLSGEGVPQPTHEFQRVLQSAVFGAQSQGQREAGVTDVLVALFSQKQSHAVLLLNQHGVTLSNLMRIVAPGAPVEPDAVKEPHFVRGVSTMRIGTGLDVHAFGPGDFVMLAGVRVPYTRGVVAHSDGDVVLHAVCDALLGAGGLGDIGEHFRDSDPQWRGADSKRFVHAVMEMLSARGLSVVNADVTVLAEAPKLAAYRAEMRRTLAELLRVPEAQVNIKATTTERLGFIGRGEGIAAQAVVLLEAGGFNLRSSTIAAFKQND